MKFTFTLQPYQSDAVQAVVRVFESQPYIGPNASLPPDSRLPAGAVFENQEGQLSFEPDPSPQGSRCPNAPLLLSREQLLQNIRQVQLQNHLAQSASLINPLGQVSLDIEMETGTGKTYVYIKTMFELYTHYGWSRFIVVAPSIAIREGIQKTFAMTEEHFMQQYNTKARYFVYNSQRLSDLNNFISGDGLHVMIINAQAFVNKESRVIHTPQESFSYQRPSDVLRTLRPIFILDEPQRLLGQATQEALKEFDPLFCLNYSATHKQAHNLVYALDALDAYNQRLVKKLR